MEIGEMRIISKIINGKRTIGFLCDIGEKTYGRVNDVENNWDAVKSSIPEIIKQMEECMARLEEQNDNR